MENRKTRWKLSIRNLGFFAYSSICFFLVAVAGVQLSRHYFQLSDETIPYAAGLLVSQGVVPFRDYEAQSGPIPTIIDTIFQHLFGHAYFSSIMAGLFIAGVGAAAIFALVRQSGFTRMATLLALVWFTLEAVPWHSVYAYAEFGIFALAGLAAALSKTEKYLPRATLSFVFGLTLSMICLSRQATGSVVVLGLALWYLASYLVLKPGVRASALSAAPNILWMLLGFASVWLAIDFLPGIIDASSREIFKQLFLDAGQKKGVSPLLILDSLLGGWLLDGNIDVNLLRRFNITFYVLALCNVTPLVCAAIGIGYVRSRRSESERALSRARILSLVTFVTLATALFCMIYLLLFGLFFNFAPEKLALSVGLYWKWVNVFPLYYLPRGVLLCALLLNLYLWKTYPRLTRIIFICLTLFVLDFSFQLSWPGIGYAEQLPFIIGISVVALFYLRDAPEDASTQWRSFMMPRIILSLSPLKAWGSWAAMASFLLISCIGLATGRGAWPAHHFDGFYGAHQESLSSPLLRGIRVSEAKARFLNTWSALVHPGDTCFVYGAGWVLYALTECKNPTRMYFPQSDALTETGLQSVERAFRNNLPKWLVVGTNTVPPMKLDGPIGGDPRTFFRQPFQHSLVLRLHRAVRSVLGRYQLRYQYSQGPTRSDEGSYFVIYELKEPRPLN